MENVTLPTLTTLSLVGVADNGVPNKERVVLRPLEPLNLGHYILCLGIPKADGFVTLLTDHLFVFGGPEIAPPCWVFVYTGLGDRFKESTTPDGLTAYSFHWGRSRTVFHRENIVPVLLRLGGIDLSGPVSTHAPDPDSSLSRVLGLPPPPAYPKAVSPSESALEGILRALEHASPPPSKPKGGR